MLDFYDEDLNSIAPGEVLRFHGDGHLGESSERKVYIRNDDPKRYFTDVRMEVYTMSMAESGVSDDASWSVKLSYGERRPTEKEWDYVQNGNTLSLPDVGSAGDADTDTYHPVWIRTYIPGGSTAQYRQNKSLRLYRRSLPA